jgi:hypothetical protein
MRGNFPLAFMLAMAVSASVKSAGGPANLEGMPLLTAGSLTALLEQGALSSGPEGQLYGPRDQTAQWSNFKNCVKPNWRNC